MTRSATRRAASRAARARRLGLPLVLLLAGVAAAAAGPPTATATSGPEPAAARAAVDDDFDGDGFADLAVSSDGGLHIVYGSAGGLTAARTRTFVAADLPSAPAVSATFGRALATGNFDGDAYGDLAVADDGATVDGFEDAGAVIVLYGSAAGLTATGSRYVTQNTAGGPGSAGLDDRFGRSLAAADLGRGSADDLVVGSSSAEVGGAVHVLYGASAGLGRGGTQVLSQATPGIQGAPERGDTFGWSLAAADFDGSGPADLAIGAPQEKVGAVPVAGAVHVILGSSTGLTAAGDQVWHRGSPGIKGQVAPYDFFGFALAAGHFAGRATADLAVETWEDRSISVLYGSRGGLTATGDQLWDAGSAGLPTGAFGGEDLLPGSLTTADFGRNPAAGVRDDLAVGVQGAVDGGVLVLYGAASGLSAAGSTVWSQGTAGVPGIAERGDAFGSSLAAGRFDGGRYASLAVGAPTESIRGLYPAGTVHILRGGASTGLRSTGVQLWTAEALGLEPADHLRFGEALAAAPSR